MNPNQIKRDLIELSHALGEPGRDWAMLGEGNTSARISPESFLVKASGSKLATLHEDQLAEVRIAPILSVLSGTDIPDDVQIKSLLLGATAGGEKMPSVETLMHAYLLTLPGVAFIGHTHVTSINGLLCSKAGWEAVSSAGRMFPDEIVVCGVAPCCVSYVDPGVPLARAIRDAVTEYIGAYAQTPRTIYLQNHGFVAIGESAAQVLDITMMADKAARIMLGAFACGGPTFLSSAHVARIHTRPDEHFRRAAIEKG